MAKYLFARAEDRDALLQLVRPSKDRLPSSNRRQENRLTTGWAFRTPSGGIAGRNGDVCSKADCIPLYINDDELVEIPDSDPVEVFNVFSTEIAGDTIITVKELYRKLVADAEDCGAAQYGTTPSAATSLPYGSLGGETI